MAMYKDNEKPPSASDTDDRRDTPIVPGGDMSTSSEGLLSALPTGAEKENTTAEENLYSVVPGGQVSDAVSERAIGDSTPDKLDALKSLTATIFPIIDQNRDDTSLTEDNDVVFPAFHVESGIRSDSEESAAAAMDVNYSQEEIIMIEDDGDDLPPPPTPYRVEKRKARSSPGSQESPQDSPVTKGVNSYRLLKKPRPSRLKYRDPPSSTNSLDGRTRMEVIPVEQLESLNSKELSDLTSDCLEKMELIRSESRSLQGPLSGSLKRGLLNISEIFSIILTRLDLQSGNDSSIRAQNAELTAQMRVLKRDELMHSRELSILKKENADLKKELETLRDRIGKIESREERSRDASGPSVFRFGNNQTGRVEFNFDHDKKLPNEILDGELRPEQERPLPQRPRKIEDRPFSGKYKIVKRPDAVESNASPVSTKIDAVKVIRNRSRSGPSTSELEDLEDAGSSECPSLVRNKYKTPDRKIVPRSDTSRILETNEELGKIEQYIECLAMRKREIKESLAPRLSRKSSNTDDGLDDGYSMDKTPRRVPASAPFVPPRRRPPRSAAVSITNTTSGTTYADILKKAREKIDLKSLGIEDSRIRKGINGGLIIEIPGENGAAKADNLSRKLREVLSDTGARVNRPVAMGELRVWNFDDSITDLDVINAISIMGDCDESEIKIGNIRAMRNGLNSVWIKCPLAAAIRVSSTSKLKLGWTVARIELLSSRPVQCFKCWRYGHVRNNCSFPEDRSGSCFKCGSRDHQIGECRADPRCVICEYVGKPAGHRLGSNQSCFERDTSGGHPGGIRDNRRSR